MTATTPTKPAGWRLVPVEPTEAMMNAAPASHSAAFQAIWPKICGDLYRAMLAAAPEPAASPPREVQALLDALSDFEQRIWTTDLGLAWKRHVQPEIARLRASLASDATANSKAGDEDVRVIEVAIEAMEDDPFVDDIHLLGTSQQSARIRHYATVALSAKSSACDCERGHNGLGMSGRECDCAITPAPAEERRVAGDEDVWGALAKAPLDDLISAALASLTDLDDWTNVNETEFTGWGDGRVPAGATFWRVKSGQALKALRDLAAHRRKADLPSEEVNHG